MGTPALLEACTPTAAYHNAVRRSPLASQEQAGTPSTLGTQNAVANLHSVAPNHPHVPDLFRVVSSHLSRFHFHKTQSKPNPLLARNVETQRQRAGAGPRALAHPTPGARRSCALTEMPARCAAGRWAASPPSAQRHTCRTPPGC